LRAQLPQEDFATQLVDDLIAAHRAHDDLVKALQDLLECADSDDFNGAPSIAVHQQARAALAKAQS
jgi:hypothetical protein